MWYPAEYNIKATTSTQVCSGGYHAKSQALIESCGCLLAVIDCTEAAAMALGQWMVRGEPYMSAYA